MAVGVALGLFLSIQSAFAWCPTPNDLQPHCLCYDMNDGGMMQCNDMFNPEELFHPIQATANTDMFSLSIVNSSLFYLPDGLFKNTRFEKVRFLNTHLMSLSESDYAFEGLEDTMIELRATEAHYATRWQWWKLTKLKKLELIDINWISLGSISETMPSLPSLNALGLIRGEISFIVDYAFANLTGLRIFDMQQNNINTFKRNMLPFPAHSLGIIDLSDNDLYTLPEDFFAAMPVLTDVHLKNNKFSTIERKIFSWAFSHLHTLLLKGNEIRCDCRMQWLVNARVPFLFDAVCELPKDLKDRPVRNLSMRELVHC